MLLKAGVPLFGTLWTAVFHVSYSLTPLSNPIIVPYTFPQINPLEGVSTIAHVSSGYCVVADEGTLWPAITVLAPCI